MGKAKDFTDQKFGRLTFISTTDKRDADGCIIWVLKCECGNFTEAVGKEVARLNINSCGCLRVEAAAKNARKFPPRISSARVMWKSNYSDGCDFETFLKLSQLNCHYCNSTPSNRFNRSNSKHGSFSEVQRTTGTFIYNGLDRIDSSKNHSPNNIVPCCCICNYMKSNIGYDKFIAHISQIYNFIVGQSNSRTVPVFQPLP